MQWKVTYTHDRALNADGTPFLTYEVIVEAPSEDVARMRAGMARAMSHWGKFTKKFYHFPGPRWIRLGVERVD